MPVDLMHSFPLNHEQAVDILVEAPWSPHEKEWILKHDILGLYELMGSNMKKHWYLEQESFPLPKHYKKRFAIGDGGDMVALMLLNFMAVIKEEKFNLSGNVKALRDQWLNKGVDPVTLQMMPRKT